MTTLEEAFDRAFGQKVEKMEREYICDGSDKEPHEKEGTVLIAKIGTSPAAPACPACGRAMRRVYEPTAVKYHPTWEQGRKWV